MTGRICANRAGCGGWPGQAARAATGWLRLACLLSAWLLVLPAMAGDAKRIIDTPIAVPESLLKKMDTFRLRPEAGAAVVGYMAEQDAALIRSWLRSEGYLDAEVDASVEEGKALWRVRAGELWHIRHVEVLPAADTKVALPHPGDAFRSEAYEKAKAILRWSWLDAG